MSGDLALPPSGSSLLSNRPRRLETLPTACRDFLPIEAKLPREPDGFFAVGLTTIVLETFLVAANSSPWFLVKTR